MWTHVLTAISLLGSISTSFANTLIPQFSFGQSSPLVDKGGSIPNFNVLGEGHAPRLMSDRVILTPPNPGNKRGAVWTNEKHTATTWSVDLHFRASGPERAGGNLQLWYVAEGKEAIGTSSIYTVGKFDGLVVVVDSHGGSTGRIRGFLNDGSRDHRSNPMVDGLAFGHCSYAYRNLGRPSKLTLTSSPHTGLEVHIDDQPCFSSDKITLPENYYLGITAASSETPDSIEVFKLSTYSSDETSPPPAASPSSPKQAQQQQKPVQSPPETDKDAVDLQDTDASQYQTSATQFADLHNRLQLLSHAVHNLFVELSTQHTAAEKRHTELLNHLVSLSASTSSSSSTTTTSTNNLLNSLDRRLQNLESTLASLGQELKSSDHRTQFARLHERLERAQAGISDHLPQALAMVVHSSTPRVGFLVALVVAVQVGLAAAYVVYKRRRQMAPKKYL